MACLSISGYSKGCDKSIGGIKKVALFEKAGLDLTGATISAGQMTALTVYDGYTGYTYDFIRDNANWTEPIVGDGIITAVYFQPTITLMFRKWSLTLRNEIEELSKGEIVAFVQDYNDNYWVFGTDKGLLLRASDGSQSGNNFDEMNGATVVLQSEESYPGYNVDMETIGNRISDLF